MEGGSRKTRCLCRRQLKEQVREDDSDHRNGEKLMHSQGISRLNQWDNVISSTGLGSETQNGNFEAWTCFNSLEEFHLCVLRSIHVWAIARYLLFKDVPEFNLDLLEKQSWLNVQNVLKTRADLIKYISRHSYKTGRSGNMTTDMSRWSQDSKRTFLLYTQED